MRKRAKLAIFRNVVLVGVLFCHTIIQAFIYDVWVMRKWNEVDHHYCYFIGLGDFHDKQHAITAQQVKQIDEIISKCDPSKTKLIFEDVSSAGSLGTRCCGNFIVNSNGGILGGLANKYRAKGFTSVENVEYRFCRVASLAPVINNIRADYRQCKSTACIKIDNFKKEVERAVAEIDSYQEDNAKLKKWYTTCTHDVLRAMNQLKFSSMADKSIADYIYYNSNEKERLFFVKQLLVFDTNLIDAKIVHHIVAAHNKYNVVVIAGGSHVKNVSNMLESIGFERIYNSTILFKKEYNVNKCLGGHIAPGGFCRKPQPVDLDIIHRFL